MPNGLLLFLFFQKISQGLLERVQVGIAEQMFVVLVVLPEFFIGNREVFKFLIEITSNNFFRGPFSFFSLG